MRVVSSNFELALGSTCGFGDAPAFCVVVSVQLATFTAQPLRLNHFDTTCVGLTNSWTIMPIRTNMAK
jgi:hypothetical protein